MLTSNFQPAKDNEREALKNQEREERIENWFWKFNRWHGTQSRSLLLLHIGDLLSRSGTGDVRQSDAFMVPACGGVANPSRRTPEGCRRRLERGEGTL